MVAHSPTGAGVQLASYTRPQVVTVLLWKPLVGRCGRLRAQLGYQKDQDHQRLGRVRGKVK